MSTLLAVETSYY